MVRKCCWERGILKPVLSLTEPLCEERANRFDAFGCPWGSCSFRPFPHPPKCPFKPSFIWEHGPVHQLCPSRAGSGQCSSGLWPVPPSMEATLGSCAQNIFHLALVNFVSIFSNGTMEIWYKGYPKYCLTSLTGTRLFSSLPVSVLKPRRGYVCLQNITHTRGKKEYRWSHWCPINK